ncbi:hypothetical protein K474DRAFT_1637636 [Panus rudis PR-1116 ss-1]|nr:hypothetical protein K474DRAFT_1637636 [Panus rudis PR-1116 ss-1]
MMWDLRGAGANAPNGPPGSSHTAYYQAPAYRTTPSIPMPEPEGANAPAPYMPMGAPAMASPPMSAVYSAQPWQQHSNQPPAPPGYRAPSAMAADYTYSYSHHSSSSHRHSSHSPRPPTSSHHAQPSSRPHKHRPHTAPIQQHVAPALHSQTSYPGGSEHFQYSRCTGRRKAVCIGINYPGQSFQLYGCVNDAKNVHRFLTSKHNYKAEDIWLLTDDSRDSRAIPTRKNILAAMRWLVKDAQPNDALFFHYSGHGGQVKDTDGDEVDGYDEVIFPLDYKSTGVITDDVMNSIMVTTLPTGCRLTALFDSCHSGSILGKSRLGYIAMWLILGSHTADLPYLYHTNGRVKKSQVREKHRKRKGTQADVISWSGCKDSQTSADTVEDGVATGAMSFAFMTSLKSNPHQTYQQLLRSVREVLKKNYSQKPQLSSSHRIDTNLKFIM